MSVTSARARRGRGPTGWTPTCWTSASWTPTCWTSASWTPAWCTPARWTPARALTALLGIVVAAVAASTARVQAQEADTRPAFSLASSQIFTTRDSPALDVMFQQVDHLDFRVYRVKDATAFFTGLKDPHTFGSPEPVVAQERTWLERLAEWKAGRRADVHRFLRRQLSGEYRAERRRQIDQTVTSRRQTLRYTTFAQVPLLNESQLVASWREVLPRVRDAESRRLPLDLPGAGVYLVEAVHAPHRAYTIVIVSDVGLLTKASPQQALLFAANRFSGVPIANCQTGVVVDRKVVFTGSTAADGTSLAAVEARNPDAVIALAQCGGDVVVSDPGAYQFQAPTRDLAAYIYTDKPIYRPGHTVRLKGVLRWRDRDAIVPFDRPEVELSIVDPADKVLQRQQVKIDAFGAISGSFTVPAFAALGYYTIRLTSGDQNATGAFDVQEYRKPEFEVSVTPAERFAVQGRQVSATITARYYFGQPVARGAVTYGLYKASYYSPFRWQDDAEESEYAGGYQYAGEQIGEGTVRLDDRGEATIAVTLPQDADTRDYTLRIDARVTDASGREVSGKGRIVGTYGDFFLSTSLDRYVYQPGSGAELRIRAMDYQGTIKPNVPVSVRLEKLDYRTGYGRNATVTTIAEGTVQTDAEGRASWKATFPKGDHGTFRFRATAPSGDRTVEDDSAAWISGYAGRQSTSSDQYLELIADQKSYAPGQTARLLIRGAEMDATVLVTKEARSIAWHQVMPIKAGQAIEVPVTEEDIGDTWVNIAFMKDDRLYRAERKLRVPEAARGLQIAIDAQQAVAKPREPGVFTIRTTDASGTPVRAQVSLAVVDEAVFAVKPDATPDPVRFFYRREYSRVSTSFSREYSFIGYSGADSLQLASAGAFKRRPLALADFKGDKEARPHVRKEFPDAIFWVADLVTDEHGTATVKIAYPDALTTWRLTARAVTADTRAGAALSRTTTTKDVILRVITPRFLTEGDTVRVPTVAHNYLPEAKAMTVTVEAKNLTPVGAIATTPQQAEIPSGGERRHEWPFTASQVGTAAITGTLVTPGDGDAVEQSLPVLPYGVKRETGQSGSITGATERRFDLTIPEPSNPAARTIEVALAPSLAGAMLSALDFLADYPYGCTEQTVSSFFPNLVVLRALADLRIAPAERLTRLDRMSADGITRLLDLQHDDGGWGWWKTDQNHPFMTAYALWALIEAQKANVPVEPRRIRQAVDATATQYATYPRAIPELKAYMVYVLGQAATRGLEPASGDDTPYDHAKALDELWAARGTLTPYTRALLLMTLDAAKDGRGDALARDLAGSAQTKGELSWWPSDNDPLLEDWADTSVEATAFALSALAPRMPNDPLLERAARWLLLNRNGGYYWTSTKQTAFALMGLLSHLRARGEKPATVTVDVEVNGTIAGTHTFTPDQWTNAHPVVLTAPGRPGVNTVRLITKSAGAVYYTATARYYDNRESLEREGTRTLALSRKYFSLTPIQQGTRIVYREQPFTGSAKPGDLLLVRLVAAGSKDWRYVMLEDPLPAGAEAIRDPNLYELEQKPDWWYGSQREYRDNRIVQFQTDFDRGRYEYTYLLKVVTPGRFRAMPAQISPMYVPDVFATTGTQTLDVSSPDPKTSDAPSAARGADSGAGRGAGRGAENARAAAPKGGAQ